MRPIPQCGAPLGRVLLLAGLTAIAALDPSSAHAQPTPASAPASAAAKPALAPKPSAGPAWSELKPAEQAALKPLQSEWASIDDLGKRKWIRIAERYPAMSAADQARLQARMTEWAKLSPQERGKVRLQFLEAKKLPATDRQADWQAYQALSPDERKALAARRATAPRATAKPAQRAASGASAKHDAPRTATPATAAKPAAPAVVQGTPGATTVLITKRRPAAAPPANGGTKIAVSPDLVDQSTLLPRAGPQGTTARSASAPAVRQ